MKIIGIYMADDLAWLVDDLLTQKIHELMDHSMFCDVPNCEHPDHITVWSLPTKIPARLQAGKYLPVAFLITRR